MPMFFLQGVARFLFVPLAEAVVFAMIASYILSRTLVPTMALLLLRSPGARTADGTAARKNCFQRLYHAFDAGFERLRAAYIVLLSLLLARRRVFGVAFLGFCLASLGLVFVVGQDFFPSVNSRRHTPAHAGADRHAHRGDRPPRRSGR